MVLDDLGHFLVIHPRTVDIFVLELWILYLHKDTLFSYEQL